MRGPKNRNVLTAGNIESRRIKVFPSRLRLEVAAGVKSFLRGSGAALLLSVRFAPRWWNWQTRRSQKPVLKQHGGSSPPLGTIAPLSQLGTALANGTLPSSIATILGSLSEDGVFFELSSLGQVFPDFCDATRGSSGGLSFVTTANREKLVVST